MCSSGSTSLLSTVLSAPNHRQCTRGGAICLYAMACAHARYSTNVQFDCRLQQLSAVQNMKIQDNALERVHQAGVCVGTALSWGAHHPCLVLRRPPDLAVSPIRRKQQQASIPGFTPRGSRSSGIFALRYTSGGWMQCDGNNWKGPRLLQLLARIPCSPACMHAVRAKRSNVRDFACNQVPGDESLVAVDSSRPS
jgi:hypothetical protein